MNLSVPDIYHTRVVFELDKDTQHSSAYEEFIKNYKNIIKKYCGLKESYFEKNSGICGCENDSGSKYVSNSYQRDISELCDGNFLRIVIRFYNTTDDKWSFDELNSFIKLFNEYSSEFVDTDYMKSFIQLELEI
jgi:hypothetical protein